MNPARLPIALPLLALVLLVVFLLQGCASVQQTPAEPDAQDKPRTMQASYVEPACQSVAAFGLITGLGLPIYMVVSGWANRACAGAAK